MSKRKAKNLIQKCISFIAVLILSVGIVTVPASAADGTYEVSDFAEFKAAVKEINAASTDGPFTISLKGDIAFGADGYDAEFNKNTTPLN